MSRAPTAEYLYWQTPPRNDCAGECSTFIEIRQRLIGEWQTKRDAAMAESASKDDRAAALLAIGALQELMAQSWECPGRMDLHVDDTTTPCRNPVLNQLISLGL